MTPRVRTALFAAAALAAIPVLLRVAPHMPAFGAHPTPYGDAINAAGPAQRQIENMVTALNFDFRGFDTLGEEFILLCAVTGVSVLLRGARGEQRSARPGHVEGRVVLPPPEAVSLVGRVVGVVLLLFGLTLSVHATSTPGGGFQGGVVIASGFLLIFLGEDYRGWRGMIHSEVMDAAEAAGAMLYALSGFAGLVAGAGFLANVLPFGTLGSVWSGGLVIVLNAAVTLAVAGGFSVLFLEFLEETRVDPEEGE